MPGLFYENNNEEFQEFEATNQTTSLFYFYSSNTTKPCVEFKMESSWKKYCCLFCNKKKYCCLFFLM